MEVIPIEKEKRIDWNVIRAEYIGGGMSFRKLAEKYDISKDTVARKAKAEKWDVLRKKARDKAATKSIQKVANVAADNAVIAADIQGILLRRLRDEILAMPDSIGSEMHQNITTNAYDQEKKESRRTDGGKRYKLRDFTLAYKDLTEDMPKEADTSTMEKLDALLQEAWDAAYR